MQYAQIELRVYILTPLVDPNIKIQDNFVLSSFRWVQSRLIIL